MDINHQVRPRRDFSYISDCWIANILARSVKQRHLSLPGVPFFNLYFRTVHVVLFILFKPTHALFLKHIHIHI